MEAGLESITGSAELVLTTGDGQRLTFKNLADVREWLVGVQGLVHAAKADEDYAALTGIKRQVADVITEEFRRQIAIKSAEAAKAFPEDVLIGDQWLIDVRRADDPNHVLVTVQQHIKALITAVAGCFGAVTS